MSYFVFFLGILLLGSSLEDYPSSQFVFPFKFHSKIEKVNEEQKLINEGFDLLIKIGYNFRDLNRATYKLPTAITLVDTPLKRCIPANYAYLFRKFKLFNKNKSKLLSIEQEINDVKNQVVRKISFDMIYEIPQNGQFCDELVKRFDVIMFLGVGFLPIKDEVYKNNNQEIPDAKKYNFGQSLKGKAKEALIFFDPYTIRGFNDGYFMISDAKIDLFKDKEGVTFESTQNKVDTFRNILTIKNKFSKFLEGNKQVNVPKVEFTFNLGNRFTVLPYDGYYNTIVTALKKVPEFKEVCEEKTLGDYVYYICSKKELILPEYIIEFEGNKKFKLNLLEIMEKHKEINKDFSGKPGYFVLGIFFDKTAKRAEIGINALNDYAIIFDLEKKTFTIYDDHDKDMHHSNPNFSYIFNNLRKWGPVETLVNS